MRPLLGANERVGGLVGHQLRSMQIPASMHQIAASTMVNREKFPDTQKRARKSKHAEKRKERADVHGSGHAQINPRLVPRNQKYAGDEML